MRQFQIPILTAVLGLIVLAVPPTASAVEIFVGDGITLDPTSTPAGNLPILFVHGHNPGDENLSPNYRNNWLLPLGNLPSFASTLAQNSELGIEPYYIRLCGPDVSGNCDEGRSIINDANEIREAVNIILERHDPSFDSTNPNSTTLVKIVIIAYSKGTISTRLYLKNLLTERPGFQPVSEFIAIAPPNHGLRLPSGTSCASEQLMNGRSFACFAINDPEPCSPSSPVALNFITNLNAGNEAPGSRPPLLDGRPTPPTNGTLYVTLFDADDRDFVGGDQPADSCGRRQAVNRSSNAVNIPVEDIVDDGWEAITIDLGGLENFIDLDETKKSIAVHQNTVHTPDVICKALYAAVHHRSPENQSCGLVNGQPEIPAPARAAAMLTLDFSGSMSAPACVGCTQTRADVLKDAVELFVQLWSLVGVPSDRIGVTYFRTNVTQFPTSGDPLPFLSAAANNVITDVQNQTPSNTTAMGGGLQRSIAALKDPNVDASIRRVILFTDGMQNVSPLVQRVNNELVIASATPTVLEDNSQGIAIDTIGVGAGEAFVGLLDEIADETLGRTWLTTAPDDDLRRFFVEQLINALRGFSPQLVAYRHGSVGTRGSTETFAIEGGARKLVLKVSWKRGASLDFSVAKDGVDVTSAGRFVNGAFYKFFVIDLPARGSITSRGNWQVRIKSSAGTEYEAAAIVDGNQITYDARFGGRLARVGDPLEFIVRLNAGREPAIRNPRVTVNLMRPALGAGEIIAGKQPKQVVSFEPGATAAERQMLAFVQDNTRWNALKPTVQTVILKPNGKGEFHAQFRPQVPGIYKAFVTIEADHAKLGRLSRTLTATTVVRFANPKAKTSDISVSESSVSGRRYVWLTLSPRNARGQRMGPGMSSAVSLKLSTGRMVGTHDFGDGRYVMLLELAAREDPTIKLDVAGSEIFIGKLSQVRKR